MNPSHEAFVNQVLAENPNLQKSQIASTALELAMDLFPPHQFAEFAKAGKIDAFSLNKPASRWVRVSFFGLAAAIVCLFTVMLSDHWIQLSRLEDQRATSAFWERRYDDSNEDHQKLCADIREKLTTGELVVRPFTTK